ncbi:hypothetical protein ACIQ9E_14695 [Streptomyces sp. NPDC094448]|uniref:hypothetical protein n=1 Tax=Streptomyces sp. NPDC094448 TaxID=3366063 RepID=UPI003810C3E3
MQTYEPSRQPYPSPIPGMRPAYEAASGFSLTPIFDALYSEYRRSFRALPGDRSGEEHLGFLAFSTQATARGAGQLPYAGAGWQPYPVRQHPAALPPAPRRSP